VSGKTGTAQVISIRCRRRRQDGKGPADNGWFVLLRPRDKPEIAGVVFLRARRENGSNAGSSAP